MTKNKGPPVYDEEERYKMVRAIKWVDQVCLFIFIDFKNRHSQKLYFFFNNPNNILYKLVDTTRKI